MGCEDVRKLLHGYLDGELDLLRSLELENHLEGCAACAEAHRGYLALRAAVNAPEHYFRAPESLRRRIRAAVEQPVRQTAETAPFAARRTVRQAWRWLALAAGVAVAFFLVRELAPARADLLAGEVLASHVRSLMPGHLTDVESGDGHTVKPWFAGKLDFSPPSPDLGGSGFPLLGGRLDYIGGRTVAALVYGRRLHRINVFIWPAPGAADRGPKSSSRQGYNSVRWVKSGMEYWAISDLNGAELQQFVGLFSR